MLTLRKAKNKNTNSPDRIGAPRGSFAISKLWSWKLTKGGRTAAAVILFLVVFYSTVSLPGKFKGFLLQEQPSTNLNEFSVSNLADLDLDLLHVRQQSEETSSTSANGTASIFSTKNDDFHDDYSQWLGCMTDDCIQNIASRIARAFPPRLNKSSWCHSHPEEDTSHHSNNGSNTCSGFLLTKNPKSASSTCAGVTLRIAHRHQCRRVEWEHNWRCAKTAADGPGYDASRSFLWTTVRDPAQRAVSRLFFYFVSRARNRTTASSDESLLEKLRTFTHPQFGTVAPSTAGFQLQYTLLDDKDRIFESFARRNQAAAATTKPEAWNPQEPERAQDPAFVVALVQSVIQTNGFILVPERMDESLVALVLTLQIDVGDVLVASSKSSSSQYHFTRRCLPIVPSFTSPALQTYFASREWRALNYGDYLLHAAAHISLDRTIEQFNNKADGSSSNSTFAEALQRYRALQALVRSQCPTPDFPCSADGKPQIELAARNCYVPSKDYGCGYPCVDALLLELENKKQKKNAPPAM